MTRTLPPPVRFRRDPEEVMTELAAHGKGIATFLLVEGIRGRAGSSADCPVARYLERETGVRPCIGVDSWCSDGRNAERGPFRKLPDPVLAFIEAIDLGQHHELGT